MFDRIRKLFSREDGLPPPAAAAASAQVAQWAQERGLQFQPPGEGKPGFAVEGRSGAQPWRMELGRPSRNFIRGEELRARAELGIDEDLAVLVMNRVLKTALEKKAYSLYTDQLQTSVDPNLPEEMRWLAMYEEFAWEGLPEGFWSRYAVMADQRENAMAWIDEGLARLLQSWPQPAPGAEVPFMLMLLRGKAYLRMEYAPAGMATFQHAAEIFTAACDSARRVQAPDLAL